MRKLFAIILFALLLGVGVVALRDVCRGGAAEAVGGVRGPRAGPAGRRTR